ncbi:MAG: DUF507 family protein [Bdellovibrionales bacterium]|nr:DUF507 family protein [Bdellovibrionales bacterium]
MKTTGGSGRTNFESIKLLCQSVARRLEQAGMIAIDREKRGDLVDSFAQAMSKHILTQEDMETTVLSSIGEKNEELDDLRLSGGEAYRTLKQSWMSKYGENEVDGLYFQEPIKYIAARMIGWLMKSPFVEEVFEEDAVLEKAIVQTIGSFRRSKLH